MRETSTSKSNVDQNHNHTGMMFGPYNFWPLPNTPLHLMIGDAHFRIADYKQSDRKWLTVAVHR